MQPYRPARIIDAHSHIFPDALAPKATQSIGQFYDIPMMDVGNVDALLKSGSEIGTDRYLVCSTATVARQVHSINDFILASCNAHPEFFGFATLHPDLEDIEAEADRIVSMGLHGIKLHHDFQRFDIDAECAMPIYRAAAKRGLPILFHMGDAHRDFSKPHRLARIASLFPELTCIAAHFGGYHDWSEAYAALYQLPNVYFDTSSSLAFITPLEARAFLHRMGIERFFFGTDFPMWSHADEYTRMMQLELTPEQYDKLFYQNFERLFHLQK